jgi:ABC-type polysaccharide/polyol phosphate transport system ATPase subunit
MKGYKTLAVNGAAAVLPVIDFALNNGEVVGAVLGANGAAAISILALINMVLRWVTTTPVLKQE